jgi:hypothetical protein
MPTLVSPSDGTQINRRMRRAWRRLDLTAWLHYKYDHELRTFEARFWQGLFFQNLPPPIAHRKERKSVPVVDLNPDYRV